MPILFFEQAVCEEGTKMGKKGLMTIDITIVMAILRRETISLLFNKQKQKRARKDFWDCYMTLHDPPNRHTYIISLER